MKRRKFIKNMAGLTALTIVSTGDVFGKEETTKAWHIEQFKDKGLAHFSYAILVDKNIVLVDPQRDPSVYENFAKQQNATIIGIVETHPHADFTSSHLEIAAKHKAIIYASSLTKPAYPFTPFDEGHVIKLNEKIQLRSLYTPGHAPDHVAAVLEENGKDIAVFSGDALLIGDVGRPDLRDYSSDVQAKRRKLAGMMYHTVHEKFGKLNDDVIVYPTHGAGSLCGKAIRDANSSTIGYERTNNYAFSIKNEQEFVDLLLSDLPFIPKYFPYDVGLNVQGAHDFDASISAIKILQQDYHPDSKSLMVDARPAATFRNSFLTNAINLQDGTKFETWLGSVIAPGIPFYLIAENNHNLLELIKKTAKIGYESSIKGAFVYTEINGNKLDTFNTTSFDANNGEYTIIDVRTEKEFKGEKIFDKSINIPLPDLANRIQEIPKDKPILVHCASGYRSATGISILKKYLPNQSIFDLGTAVSKYEKKQDTTPSIHQ